MEMNTELEKAFRVADFIELGQLMAIDALHRNESCGGHFREDHATPEGEAERDDVNFKYVAAWNIKVMILRMRFCIKKILSMKTSKLKLEVINSMKNLKKVLMLFRSSFCHHYCFCAESNYSGY